MSVKRLVLSRPPSPLDRAPEADGPAVRPFGLAGDAELVTRLARAGFVAAGGSDQPWPGPAGLLGELASRPNRRVEAWLAVSDCQPTPLPQDAANADRASASPFPLPPPRNHSLGGVVEGQRQPAAGGPDPLGLVTLVKGGTPAVFQHSLAWLVVAPTARRRGIGRRLAAAACQRAWQLGAEQVWVQCRADWRAAIAFWHALGFDDHPQV